MKTLLLTLVLVMSFTLHPDAYGNTVAAKEKISKTNELNKLKGKISRLEKEVKRLRFAEKEYLSTLKEGKLNNLALEGENKRLMTISLKKNWLEAIFVVFVVLSGLFASLFFLEKRVLNGQRHIYNKLRSVSLDELELLEKIVEQKEVESEADSLYNTTIGHESSVRSWK